MITATIGNNLNVDAVFNGNGLSVAITFFYAIDEELSDTSLRPLQNKVIKAAIDEIKRTAYHKPIEFSTDIEINSSNIATYNGATLFLTSADENKNITVTEDAGITEDIAVIQCGNATATWVAGTNVVINNNKKTNGIGTATALTKRVAANTFDVIGGVE